MAAMAGATATALTKRGLYNLGAGFPPLAPADLRRGIRVARRAVWITTGFALAGIIRWRN